MEPMEVELLSAPGGEARVTMGVSVLDLRGVCAPSLLCILKLAMLVCLPRFDENDIRYSKENTIITKFRNLRKNITTVKNFFDEMESQEVYQCHPEIRNIRGDFEQRIVFYQDPMTTFETKSMRFDNKIILIGTIFKDDERQSLLGECSIFHNNVIKDQFIKCFNSSISQIEEVGFSFERLTYWSIWVRVKCKYSTEDDSCAPFCVKTNRNICNNIGEKCINGYSLVSVNVKYTTFKMKQLNTFIKINQEKRCFYYNPCLRNVCGSKICYTIKNGTYQCSLFTMSVFNEISGRILSINYVQFGDILKCILVQNEDKIKNVTYMIPDIKWVTTMSNKDVKIKQNRLFIKTKDLKKNIVVSCVAQFSNYSPPYVISYEFKLYKIPTQVFIDKNFNGYVHTNQRIYCKSDGYPKKHIKYLYRITTENFQLNETTMSSEYLYIPLHAKLGALQFSCQAKIKIGNEEKVTLPKSYKLTVTNIINLQWGKEDKVIYPNTTITCDVTTNLPKRMTIKQLDGRSQLKLHGESGYKITSFMRGGQYVVLCTITAITNISLRYHRKYTFQLYKKPTSLCLFVKPGFSRIIIICLHNGYPQEKAITQIVLIKAIRKQQNVEQNKSHNKIMLFYENELSHYLYQCTSQYEDVILNLQIEFRLQDHGGIFLRGTDILKYLCSVEIDENNMNEKDKFWLNIPIPLSFLEFKICFTFIILTNIIASSFIVIHMYSLDSNVVMNLTVSALSRRHCIIRLYKKLNEVALFRVKNTEYADTSLLRAKFEAYKSSDDPKD